MDERKRVPNAICTGCHKAGFLWRLSGSFEWCRCGEGRLLPDTRATRFANANHAPGTGEFRGESCQPCGGLGRVAKPLFELRTAEGLAASSTFPIWLRALNFDAASSPSLSVYQHALCRWLVDRRGAGHLISDPPLGKVRGGPHWAAPGDVVRLGELHNHHVTRGRRPGRGLCGFTSHA